MKPTLIFLRTEPDSWNYIDTHAIVADFKKESGIDDVKVVFKRLRTPVTIGDLYTIIQELTKEYNVKFLVLDDDCRIIPKVRGGDLRTNHVSIQMELRKIVETTNIPIYVCNSRIV